MAKYQSPPVQVGLKGVEYVGAVIALGDRGLLLIFLAKKALKLQIGGLICRLSFALHISGHASDWLVNYLSTG